MPGGKTHETINIVMLFLILSGIYYLEEWKGIELMAYLDIYLIAVFSLAYLFATFFLSPDLDIDSSPYKRWGIFRILWWPYKVIFKHRGYSHNPILGPLSILINLILILLPIAIIAEISFGQIPLDYMAATVTGILISIEVHIISDAVFSKLGIHQ